MRWYFTAAFAALVAVGIWQRDKIASFMVNDNEALKNQNVQAFLRAIRAGESSQDASAYQMLVYGGQFNDFSTHPNVRKTIPGTKNFTTAAGAYQITYSTWQWLHILAGVSDFTPASQDKMAVAYLRKLGALADVVAGNYAAAADKCRPVWESFTVPKLKARIDMAYVNYGGRAMA